MDLGHSVARRSSRVARVTGHGRRSALNIHMLMEVEGANEVAKRTRNLSLTPTDFLRNEVRSSAEKVRQGTAGEPDFLRLISGKLLFISLFPSPLSAQPRRAEARYISPRRPRQATLASQSNPNKCLGVSCRSFLAILTAPSSVCCPRSILLANALASSILTSLDLA